MGKEEISLEETVELIKEKYDGQKLVMQHNRDKVEAVARLYLLINKCATNRITARKAEKIADSNGIEWDGRAIEKSVVNLVFGSPEPDKETNRLMQRIVRAIKKMVKEEVKCDLKKAVSFITKHTLKNLYNGNLKKETEDDVDAQDKTETKQKTSKLTTGKLGIKNQREVKGNNYRKSVRKIFRDNNVKRHATYLLDSEESRLVYTEVWETEDEAVIEDFRDIIDNG